jgi:hypothetical protein
LLVLAALFPSLLGGGHPSSAQAAESVWLEAEHLDGIRGYCWPLGDDKRKMRETDGHWGLSGPGWAAEWNQGGESGFLSIATGANDDKAVARKTLDIPVAGKYFIWVRYGDWRERTERFQIQLEQAGRAPVTLRFGERAIVDEDNTMKLYYGWAFAWDGGAAELSAGPATIELTSTTKDPDPRQVDVIVLTTDAQYRPRIKERPHNPAWDVLEAYRKEIPADLEPLTRKRPDFTLPEAWKLKTIKDKGFVYLWNASDRGPTADWLGTEADRVLYPWNLRDEDAIKEFKQKYGGKTEVPIFSDPRIAPAFHGVGPSIFQTDPATGEVKPAGKQFAAWLEANPARAWGGMMNYHPGAPIGPQGQALFAKYRDRYVGSIAGESLGYFYIPAETMAAATAGANTRREIAEAFSPLVVKWNSDKYAAIWGKRYDANPFEDVISCLSIGNICFAPMLSKWGCRTLGYESSSVSFGLLPMRWAFMRGLARQGGHATATYRSCNFGDASTIFSKASSYTTPQAVFDNYYSLYSGAGVTWYKLDIWYQYMAGSSMFYHEQGFDEFWRPGGTTAAGVKEIQLSPKGKLVDRFLRVTEQEPDRGVPFTPVAFLVDYAHGWEPSPFWPNGFKNFHNDVNKLKHGDHELMLEEYFRTAWYPLGPESEKPMTATNEVFVPGVFGDIFDVVTAYPDVQRWTTIDSYPAVIVAGEIELTAAEGARLAKYVERGGTLFVADAHLTGPGLAALKLPRTAATVEADGYLWMDETEPRRSPRFRFKPIAAGDGRAMAKTVAGETICAAQDRGAGRLIYLSVPHALSIGKQAVPMVAQLMAHLTRGVMPIEVQGDVEWMVNRTASGWAVTLLNPAGQLKPQQGILPTDYRENRPVTITAKVPIKKAYDRLLPTDVLPVKQNVVQCEVLAGGVRVIVLE